MIIRSSFFLLSSRWPHLFRRFGTGCILSLPHNFLLVHLFRIIDVDIWSLLLCYHPLLLFIVVQNHSQVFKDCRVYLVLEIFDCRRNYVQVHLEDVVLAVARVFITACDCEPSLST